MRVLSFNEPVRSSSIITFLNLRPNRFLLEFFFQCFVLRWRHIATSENFHKGGGGGGGALKPKLVVVKCLKARRRDANVFRCHLKTKYL